MSDELALQDAGREKKPELSHSSDAQKKKQQKKAFHFLFKGGDARNAALPSVAA